MPEEVVDKAIEPVIEPIEEPVIEAPEPDIIQEDPQVKNIREMRLIKEKAEKERDEAYRLIQQMKNSTPPEEKPLEEEVDDLNNLISDDDYVEPKHIGKIVKKIKNIEKRMQRQHQDVANTTVEAKLKNKYSDFDSVVSKENVEALVRDHPELGDTLRSNKDLYSQAVTAYTMIKEMGVYKEDKFVEDKERAIQNAGKPRPLTSVSPQQGDSPLTRANAFAGGLTDDLKKQLRKEMNDARSRI